MFTKSNENVSIIRHAQAIHERRTMFRNKPWQDYEPNGRKNRPKDIDIDLEEVWFYGFHGNIGGGQGEKESKLAKVPLTWMIDEATKQGAKFDFDVIDRIVLGTESDSDYVAPNPNGPSHNSMKGLWRVLEILPSRKSRDSKRPSFCGWTIPFFEWRYIPRDAKVHIETLKRFEKEGLFPPNIPKE